MTSQSSLEFRALAEVIPQLVFVARADGQVEYFNRRFLDYAPGPSAEWLTPVHSEDLPVAKSRWESSIASGQMFEAEARLLRKDGAYRWFLVRALPLRDAYGAVIRWFGTCTDIHDQKQTQVASQFLAEASEALASSLDVEATLVTVTRLAVPRFADWAAIDLISDEGKVHRVEVAHTDPEKAAYGWEIARKYPVNMNDDTGLAGVLKTGRPAFMPVIPPIENLVSETELLRLMKALQLRSSIIVPMAARGRILGGITFMMAESGRIYSEGDLATAEDLGRRAGVAVDNARLYKESLNVNRMKDEFLSTLSHELRTPMTAVLGWAQMLDSGRVTGDAAKKGLAVILRNARVQAQLIDDLLDMSRIITGKLRLEMAALDLNEVCRSAEDTLKPTAEAKAVKLSAALCGEPLTASGDKNRLQQVVWNLLSNAIKFTPRGGQVTLTVGRAQHGFLIEVKDTGQGISADFLPHVFERFRQQDSSTTRREGGLGLGLAVVRHLVELHGGVVTARSDGVGRGATFTVELPARVAVPASPAEDSARVLAAAASGAAVSDTLLSNLRVLVVDDQPDTRELVAQVLAGHGASVVTAASASEAFARFLDHPPDVLISDIGMPGEDGFDLLARLRSHSSAGAVFVPAVALTAYAREEDVAAVLGAGFQRHLPKPIDPTVLVQIVAEVSLRKAPGP